MIKVIEFVKINPDAIIPSYKTAGSSGMDLSSVEDNFILPGEIKIIGTGLMCNILSAFEGQIRPRSGLAAKFGITVLNTPGTIDSDYKGEIKVILINHGVVPFEIKKGDRIAQMVMQTIIREYTYMDKELLERGEGGFGSTGK